ncbi:ArnT family glycosyltransferase [Pusillimonas noertemannii]|uniref:ArnT family glycosyltransferase n=2 Tax=Pusillimonas noertemannii TaxID=305977 RepID=UPI0002FC866C|nr:glycosyltransferase family 39 protein [Pusillimonas noertemannii]
MQGVSKRAWLILMAALLLPLISMTIVPFYDTSEPRYAEIARVMAQSDDWITPWFSPGVPFWGKPPLSFWSQALSMSLFGFTEFAARLPAWICLLLSNAILIAGLVRLKGPRIAVLTAIVYSTCTLVYISSGAVLTDAFLALGTTLSLVSFAVMAGSARFPSKASGGETAFLYKPRTGSGLWWRYGFFIGLAIGLLAKGPLAAVLILAPVMAWHVLNRKAGSLSTLPWGRGLALAAALSLPWYILAEIKTPGFLDYFIIGEHLRRFLDPGWAGDLYGSAHQRAYGTIWLYWLMATFPWGLIALATAAGALRSARIRCALASTARDPLFAYWLAAALFTPLFFTFSANILWTYLLPSLAGFSVLVAIFASRMERQFNRAGQVLATASAIVPLCVLAFSAIVWVSPDLRNTERGLVQHAMLQSEPSIPLLYLSNPPFSARFYSAGKVREIAPNSLKIAAECSPPFYLAIPKDQQRRVAELLGRRLDTIYSNKRYVLVKITSSGDCGERPLKKAQINRLALDGHLPPPDSDTAAVH